MQPHDQLGQCDYRRAGTAMGVGPEGGRNVFPQRQQTIALSSKLLGFNVFFQAP